MDFPRPQCADSGGDVQGSSDRLLAVVYKELRALAISKMASERADHTLQATALVHEAYLRLVSGPNAPYWENRDHFFAAAAEAMRRILVESARRRKTLKRGGDAQRTEWDESLLRFEAPSDEILALNEALTHLEAEDPVKAELVKLRYFVGLSHQEAAQHLGISRTTADRYWVYAKAWLYARIQGNDARHAPRAENV